MYTCLSGLLPNLYVHLSIRAYAIWIKLESAAHIFFFCRQVRHGLFADWIRGSTILEISRSLALKNPVGPARWKGKMKAESIRCWEVSRQIRAQRKHDPHSRRMCQYWQLAKGCARQTEEGFTFILSTQSLTYLSRFCKLMAHEHKRTLRHTCV